MEAPELPVQAEMVELVPNGKHAAALSTTALPSLAGDRFDENQRSAEMEEFLPHGAEKKQTHFTDFEGKTSFGMSVFNLSNAIMGSGILGLAYAMANTGIVLFLFLLTAVALLSSYSIHLLLKSSGIVGIRAYEQLGYRAFGTPGKLAAAIAITLQNIGAMSSYLYIVKSEVPLVIQTFLNLEEKTADWYLNGNYLVILVSVTIILPLALMKQLGYLGYASGFSLSCMVFFLISVIYKKFHIPCPLPEQGGNGTGGLNYTAASGSGHWGGSAGLQPPEPGACTPSFFTLNSQVGLRGLRRGAPGPGHAARALRSASPPPRLADGLHHPHHGLRLRVPPRGAAHLHGAEGPLQEEDAVHLQHLHRRHVPHVLPGRPLWLPHVLRARGVGAAAHLQQGGPLRRADPLRAGGRADGRHAHRPHRPLPGAPGHPADAIPWQELQLDPPRRHRCGPADLHQPPGHFCPLHPWHLWHDRCHLCPLPHLHLPGHLLHPHHAQGQGAPALHPQNPGSLLRSPWGALHDHEPELHHHRLGHGGGQEWRQPLATLAAHPDPPNPARTPPGPPPLPPALALGWGGGHETRPA
uniref:Solute carrier family 38 member 3 n=1 Tax=Anser brachyrhynchus TaxID=132585 RepID=A0A8B9I0V5_9AVES